MPRSAAPPHFERHVEGIDYAVLDELVGYAVRRAQIAIYEDFETTLGSIDFTPQRFSALVVIAANRGIIQSQLGTVLGIARSGVNQLVNALEERGWVARTAHGSDARSWQLTVTAEGTKQLATARRRVRAHDERVAGRLTPAERETLVALLARLGADA